MNIGLLGLLGKWSSIVVISFMSFFNTNLYTEKEIGINNDNATKDVSIISTITKYKTITKYNSKIPSNISKTIIEGVDGIKYVTSENEEVQVVQEPISKVIEKGSGAYGIYKGKISGYGPDCVGCTGTGNLACKTENKKIHSLVNDGIYYIDDEYNKVRILAAALKAFPCGTIIEVTKAGKEPYMAVVLDTGASMIKAWNNGIVWMDLAYSTQKDKTIFGADGLTGANISFSVQRWGW